MHEKMDKYILQCIGYITIYNQVQTYGTNKMLQLNVTINYIQTKWETLVFTKK